MELAAEYNVLNHTETLGLSSRSTREITKHFEEIESYLLEKEYGACDLVYPNSRYMRCVQALVHDRKKPCNHICIYSCLPRQTRFHILYYEQLALHMEEKINKLLLRSRNF